MEHRITNNIFMLEEHRIDPFLSFFKNKEVKVNIDSMLIADFSEVEITKLSKAVPSLMKVNLFLLIKLWFKAWH